MNVVHVTGDWKWTGPAAPMLELILAQRARGWRSELACPAPPDRAGDSLADRARRAGAAPRLLLSRGRGVRPWADRRDAALLRATLAEAPFDVVHAWHTRGHALALRARRPGSVLVRSWSHGEAIARWPWNRWLFGPGCDGLLCVSPGSADRNRALRGGRAIAGAFGAVDLERFRPQPPDAVLRKSLGIEAGETVVGIVARVQPHRRFDLLLAAAARLASEREDVRWLVVGRGSRRAQAAEEPAARLGLGRRVRFAGHRRDDYPDVLRQIDVFTYLVPGSDGGCRALLEASACAIPAVTSRRGALPEIVVDGETGLLCDEDPESLCAAWRALVDDAGRRRALGAAARRRAERCFSRERLADAVAGLYEQARS